MVTYGGMSRKPVMLPTGSFVFNDLSLRGFWLQHWAAANGRKKQEELLREVEALILGKKLRFWAERHQLLDLPRALQRHSEPFRDRKVLLMME